MALTADGDSRDTLSGSPGTPVAHAQRPEAWPPEARSLAAQPQRGPHRPLGSAFRLAGRHWLLTVLLTAGLVLRVITQLAYRPALLYIDSPKYLINGLQKYDPQGYRILLAPLTKLGGLAVVAAGQHLLGLAMAVALYTVAIRWNAPRWAAALAAAPVLLDAYQLQIEQTIMPDVAFEAIIVAGLVILAWRPRPSPVAISVAGTLLGASATIRQVGEFLVLPLLLFCVLAARGWRARLGSGALALFSFAVPILLYMAYSALVLGGGFELSNQGDAVVYGRAAAAADCPTLHLTPAERAVCPSPATVRSYGVDGLVNDPTSPAYTANLPPGTDHGVVTSNFAHAVLEQQPLRVAVAIGEDAIKLFALTRDTSPGDTPISRWQFQTYWPMYPLAVTESTAVNMFNNSGGGGGPQTDLPLATFLRGYQLHGGWTPGPFLLVTLLAGTAGIVTGRRRGDSSAALVCLLVTGLGMAVLLGADLYEFSWRYQLPALVTLPIGGALGVAAIRGRLRSGRDPDSDESPVTWSPCPASVSPPASGPWSPGSSTPTPGSG